MLRTLFKTAQLRFTTTVRSLSFAIFLAGGLLMSPATVVAQPENCHNQPVAMEVPDPQAFVTAQSPAICWNGDGNVLPTGDVPDGGYLRSGSGVRLDAAAHTTGTCYQYTFDWYHYTCNYSGIAEIQPLWKVDTGFTAPDGTGYPVTFGAPYPSRDLDTRTGSGFLATFGTVGAYDIATQSLAYNTTCTDVMFSNVVRQAVNVVSCLPNWKLDAGQLDRFPTDGDISVAYPSSLDDAVRPAITSWNNELAKFGLTSLHFTPAPDTGCAVANAHCVSVDIQLSADDPTACGWRYTPAAPAGVYTQRSQIHLKPGFASWPSLAGKIWTVSHEFGHLLGLDHQGADCSPSGSVMHNPDKCGDDNSATSATDDDAVAVAKTVYGPGSRIKCG